MPFNAEVGHLFKTYTSPIRHSNQNWGCRPDSARMAVIISPNFLLSLGLFLVVCCLSIPCSRQNSSNSLDIYSPPLSSLIVLILQSNRFSTNALNTLKAPNVSAFFFIGITHLSLVQSSLKSAQYL